jgi:hypothetical protein
MDAVPEALKGWSLITVENAHPTRERVLILVLMDDGL